MNKYCFLIFILSLPVMVGWQKIELKELLAAPKNNSPTLDVVADAGKSPDFSPYKILEKVSSSLFQLKTVEVDTELWLENAFFHIKSNFKNRIQNVDDYKTDGRVSFSFLLPSSASSSQWVQNFQIRGLPFTWNRGKRLWEKKDLEITGKDAQAVLSYSVLRSLFTINQNEVDPSSVKILGIENRKGRDCFVLGYSLDPEIFKRWNLVGNISLKLWIDKVDFLPQILRAEGNLGNMYLLQIVNYSNFNRGVGLVLPAVISNEVKIQKEELKGRVAVLVNEVSQIRGWKPLEGVQVEFLDRVSLRRHLEDELIRNYPEGRFENEGIVFRWLGLLPKDADYKESLLNSEIASLAGLYEPRLKTIFIGDWIHPALAEPILVHEIVHAYQDRQLPLEEFMEDKESKETLDFSTARHSLLEGEATAVMLEYILRKEGADFQGLGDIFALIEEKIIRNSEYNRLSMQYNIYGYGANYIQYYLKDNKWNEMDKLYKFAPFSMKDMIHPYRRYVLKKLTQAPGQEKPLSSPQLPGAWNEIYNNRLGEFFLQLSLRQFLDKDTAEQAAAGWKNDAIKMYKDELGKKLLILRTQWIDSAAMKVYGQVFKNWLKKKYPQMVEAQEGSISVVKTTEGIFSFLPSGDELTVVWGQEQSAREIALLTEKITYQKSEAK